MVERLHRSLHSGLSHYVNATNTNWDVLTPFFLMAYRATPNTVRGYSPFYLIHRREMHLPNQDNLKAKISAQPLEHNRRLKSLKASLKLAYKSVRQANRKGHQNNKRLYDRRAKLRSFETGDQVYLYNTAVKPGRSKKYHFPWSGPFKITAKISDLNYEILDHGNKKRIVHVNRLKGAYCSETREAKPSRKRERTHRNVPTRTEREEKGKAKLELAPFR